MDLSSSFLHPFSPPHLTNVRIGRVRKERRYHVNITVLSSIEIVTFFFWIRKDTIFSHTSVRIYNNGSVWLTYESQLQIR